MSELKLQSVEIENIKGIEQIKFDAGAVTVISGRNGVGKSSILDAIAAVFDGGHDPALLRQGTEVGKVTLVLSDGVTIEKRITEKSSTYKITTADGALVKAPKTYIDQLAGGMAFDPLRFVEANAINRIAFLLQAMPVQFTVEELRTAMKDRAPLKPATLDHLNALIEGFTEQRRDLNRELKTLEATSNRLAKGLKEAGGAGEKDWSAAAETLEDEIAKVRNEITEAEKDSERQNTIRGQSARDECQSLIDEARKQFDEYAAQCQKDRDEKLSGIAKQCAAALSKTVGAKREALDKLTAELATAREKAEQGQRVQFIRDELSVVYEQAGGKQGESDNLTLCIDAMRKLKQEKLDALPIPGVDVRDGDVCVDGVTWEHVNDSEKALVAAQIAAMAVGKLGFLVLDRAEHLDDERFQNFVDAFKSSGLQVAVARVEAGKELTVEAAS